MISNDSRGDEYVFNIKRPLLLGEVFLVPCMVEEVKDAWLEKMEILYITPIIYHNHNDIENGQYHEHYHADYRFIKTGENGSPLTRHSVHKFGRHGSLDLPNIRPQRGIHGQIKFIKLPVVNESFSQITHPVFIKNSKLKHKCIYKGKCPHRGYDLSQVKEINGEIICPLHGLRFDALNGKLIEAVYDEKGNEIKD